MKEKKKFDHRKISEELEIFFLDNRIGQGLPVLLKNGVIIKNLIQDFIRSKEKEYGCQEVISPVLADSSLYKTSGHFDHYKDYIFPAIEKDNEVFQIRPMTCPHHCIIYDRKVNSYKDLPIWISEHSILHRFEPSGSLRGLERARWMELSDNHIFTSPEDLKRSFKKSFYFITEILSHFGIKVSNFICSLRKENDIKYHQNDEIWNLSEKLLAESLQELNVNFVKKVGEAAFYGPKLDIEVINSDGKSITISTIQLDFVLPKKFSLSYISNTGEKKHPIIIHHSSIGTYQRFISVLLENYKGKLPFWLCPQQFVIIPFSNKVDEKVSDFCRLIEKKLKSKNLRASFWENKKRLSNNIRRIYELKIPFYIVIGKEEIDKKILKIFDTRSEKNFDIEIEELLLFIEKNIKK